MSQTKSAFVFFAITLTCIGIFCTSAEARENGKGGSFVAGLVDSNWTGSFSWRWQEPKGKRINAEGTLSVNPSGTKEKLAFDIVIKSPVEGVCVDTLYETERRFEGHLISLAPIQQTPKKCSPNVSHAFLFPSVSDHNQVVLKMYDHNWLVSRATLNAENSNVTMSLDTNEVDSARQYITKFDQQRVFLGKKRKEGAELKQKMAVKRAEFENSFNFERLKPFYQSCMDYVAQKKYELPESYCQCMAQKFGLGGRIPEKAFVEYTKDFSKLIKHMMNSSGKEGKLYDRLWTTCRRCAQTHMNLYLDPSCTGPDESLYSAYDYQEMIRILQFYSNKLRSSKRYKSGFYMRYLQFYSANCSSEIKDPVTFRYTVTESKRDDVYWPEQKHITQQTDTLIERKYAPKYKKCYEYRNRIEGKNAANQIIDLVKNPMGVGDIKKYMAQIQEENEALQKHFTNGCQSNQVRVVYKNLYNLVE